MVERLAVEHLVVGGGAVGLAVAAAIARSNKQVIVLEAGPRAGCGISSRNSEVVHSGIYYPTQSLKHACCVEGRRLLYAYCDKRGVSYRKCGKFVVATNEDEAKKVAELAIQSQRNGVENVQLIDGSHAQSLEPSLNAMLALDVRETGIIDSHGYMFSLIAEIEDAGGAVMVNHCFTGGRLIERGGFEITIESADGTHVVTTRTLTLAAGLYTHAVAKTIEGLPFSDAPPLFLAKGSYFSYSWRSAFSRLIYPTPVDGGLGVHLTLDLNGRMRFGPDVEWLSSNDPDDIDFSVDGARGDGFYASIRRYWRTLPDGSLTPDYSGVRPKLSGPGMNSDFLLYGPQLHNVDGLVGLFGIESPGLTASLAIAERVKRMLNV